MTKHESCRLDGSCSDGGQIQEDEPSKGHDELPDRKFELGQGVWVWLEKEKETHHGIIWGYEDGRYLHHRKDCWMYHVALQGVNGVEIGDVVVGEDDLSKVVETIDTELDGL